MRDDRLRLIFTCCHPALAAPRAGRAHAAAARRAHARRRSRARSSSRADDGAAPRPGEGQDPRRADPVPRARTTPTSPTGSRGVLGRPLPDLQRGPHGERAATGSCARTCAPRRSGSRGVLAALMPDEPEVLGLLALMLLGESRRAARTTPDGELVLLADQDRAALGPRPDRGGPRARAALPAPRPARARTRSRRRSRPSTPTPPTRRGHRLGARSSRCTTSCWRSRRRRWSR